MILIWKMNWSVKGERCSVLLLIHVCITCSMWYGLFVLLTSSSGEWWDCFYTGCQAHVYAGVSEACCSAVSNPEIKSVWGITSIPHYLHGIVLKKRDRFILVLLTLILVRSY
jgi:hypothetical protein